jgi:hypothetical protein
LELLSKEEGRACSVRFSPGKEKKMAQKKPYIRWFDEFCSDDVAIVGGTNASLGEMICSLRN